MNLQLPRVLKESVLCDACTTVQDILFDPDEIGGDRCNGDEDLWNDLVFQDRTPTPPKKPSVPTDIAFDDGSDDSVSELCSLRMGDSRQFSDKQHQHHRQEASRMKSMVRPDDKWKLYLDESNTRRRGRTQTSRR